MNWLAGGVWVLGAVLMAAGNAAYHEGNPAGLVYIVLGSSTQFAAIMLVI
jgi:hypothetical protein